MNYLKLENKRPLSVFYLYIDVTNYKADRILNDKGISIKIMYEFTKPNTDYRAIICKVSKKDESKFIEAMKETENNLLITGHSDYEEVLKGIIKQVRGGL